MNWTRVSLFKYSAMLFLVMLHTSAAVFADSSSVNALGGITPARLRCEYRTDPLGVDNDRPELSWIVTAEARAQKQTAYRILVASSPGELAKEQADLWDSGKISGDVTFGVVYSGKPLKSHQVCYWKVMSWDAADRAGAWSETASWSTGILKQSEWQGEWIGYDALRQANKSPLTSALEGTQWINHAQDAYPDAPAERRIYARSWDLPADEVLNRAYLSIAADDSAEVRVNGTCVVTTRDHRVPKRVNVLAALRSGRNEIRVACTNNSKGHTGLCLRVEVEMASGKEYELVSDKDWLSDDELSDDWGEKELEDAEYVRVAGPFGMEPWGKPNVQSDSFSQPTYLRGAFQVNKAVRRATVYLASLGWADLSINGTPVNKDYFSSGWTDYRKRVYYRAYDVSSSIQQGDNVWGALLADGWYSGQIGWSLRRNNYGENPRVRAMMQVEYTDGDSEIFSTNASWTAHTGPTQVADILVGEEYDANAEIPGWDRVDWKYTSSAPVVVGAEVSPKIEWHPAPPVVEVAEFSPKTKSEPAPGAYVYDIGQNIAGVARLKITGQRGQRIRIRYGERLNPDGTLYTENLRLARATDYYTCKGDGEEIWQPRQTFHGFQYIELTGVIAPPLDAVTGIALSTDTPLASEFDCSDENLNRLYKNVLWTQRANFIDVPTDCPQRDERLGWTGDAQVYVHTACLTTDTQAFFRKWLVDLVDAQRDDGQFPKVAPVVLGQDDGGPAWSEAGVICPWEVYLAYGDKALLEQQYPSMVRYVEFCRARSIKGVLPPKHFHCFGDWLSVNADTPREVIYTAYYARSVDLLKQSAEVLGKKSDARKYAQLFKRIKQAFQKEYVNDNGLVKGDTQCAYVLAIGYGLVDGEIRELAAERLVKDIESRGWKLSTGFIGTKDLMLVLSEVGRTDVALRLLHQTEYPGWLFSISHGATSIWERWDGWTPERGFQDVGMNSFAHYSFGAVYGWMVENLGGIQTNGSAYGNLTIEPIFDPELDYCRVKYDSIRGPIVTDWKIVGDQRVLQVTVPANAEATLKLSDVSTDDLKVDNQALAAADIVGKDTVDSSGVPVAQLQLPSGDYNITIPMKL